MFEADIERYNDIESLENLSKVVILVHLCKNINNYIFNIRK